MVTTMPAPTVRPPSRMAKRSFSSFHGDRNDQLDLSQYDAR